MPHPTVEVIGRPAELLLVEDNYGDVLLAREAFLAAKIRNHLTVAEDGEDALSMLRREGRFADQPRPDVVLLDLNLPRLDGREVLQAIKQDPDLRAIPVIIMTSSKAETDVVRSYQLKANGYIVKPVDFERLQEIVGSLESFWFTVVVLAPAPAVDRADAA
jgi:chemotaxis family two-component system response regulator Rcp1